MLPTRHRMRTSAQFSATVRSGARSGRRNVVVSVRMHTGEPSRVGFVVSKAVGNAVTRHAVSRKLRHTVVQRRIVDTLPRECDVVIRALPRSAAATSDELAHDLEKALEKVQKKR